MSIHISHETKRRALEMQALRCKTGKKPRIIAIGSIAFTGVYSLGDDVRDRPPAFLLEEWDTKHRMWVGARYTPTTLQGAQKFTSRWPDRFRIASAKNRPEDTDLHKMECLTVGQYKTRPF
jgi:hypothetical protein